MNDTMYHRGPDDSGETLIPVSDGYNLGLAQRRLSIQDLSPSGHQPMCSYDNRISVVFNGEIYNFQELKNELKDYPFKSKCDTEVIIAAYLQWGIHCVEKLNGMFSIALFDQNTQELYLVRDRIGKKPLYYWLDHSNLVFGSELKPIMEYPLFHGDINTSILRRYLYHQYIDAPYTIYNDVYKLEPGSILKFTNGSITKSKFWDVKSVYHVFKEEPVRDYSLAKTELKDLLKQAVQSRMIADVPVGTFLSGGYDSSLITAIAQELSDTPVKTFSIGFEDPAFNESQYASKIAEYLGTDHTECYITEQEMLSLVESIPSYFDEPFADSSQIPTMLVSKLAKEQVTVALSGDGGDELFCGYQLYDRVRMVQNLDPLGNVLYKAARLPLIRNYNFDNKFPEKIRTITSNRDVQTKSQYISGNFLDVINHILPGDIYLNCRYPVEDSYRENNWQIRRMLLDMDTYLPDDILCKVDRASMKYALETRCPILDYKVMEFSYRLPHNFKYQHGNKKRILKDIAYTYIPRDLLERPKKGFAVPMEKWLKQEFADKLQEYSTVPYLKRQSLFDPVFTSNFIQAYLNEANNLYMKSCNYTNLIWAFLIFQMWFEKYHKKGVRGDYAI